jgi:flagellar motor protein MotB
MSRAFRNSAVIGLGLVCAWGSGCAAQKKVPQLEADNQKLRGDLSSTQAALANVQRERDMLNSRIRGMQNDIDSLRAELAGRPVVEQAPAGWTAVPGGGMIAIEENILFAPGKAVLRDEARKTLDNIVSTLSGEYGTKDIVVIGHTDDRPIKKSGWADNWQLSTERGLAVVRYLKEHGVVADRLMASGCGEFRPRVPNNSEPNRLSNRRVEIFALESTPRSGRDKC